MKNNISKTYTERFRTYIKSIFHTDYKYVCNFCNYSSNKLSRIGFNFQCLIEKQIIGGGERLGGCLNCGSIDRERLIYVYLKEKTNLFELTENKKVLHIAPEKKLSIKLINLEFNEYICGDLFVNGYNYPENVRNINILNIPYHNDCFDLIICNHVLEHIPDDLKAMKELRRVLKVGGIAILQVPISNNSEETFEDLSVEDPKIREFLFGQSDHVRIYGQDYIKRLQKCEFKVDRINISEEFKIYGLIKNEDIFVCTK